MQARVETTQASAAKAKAGNQSVASSTVLVNETDMQLAVGAGETWVVIWTLSATFAVTGGVKVAVTTPAGATLLAMVTMLSGASPAPFFGTATVSGTAVGFTTLGPGVVTVTATVANGATAGTVALQFAQNASDATATVVQAASSMVARKV